MSDAHAGAEALRIILHAYAAVMKPAVDRIIDSDCATASPQCIEGCALLLVGAFNAFSLERSFAQNALDPQRYISEGQLGVLQRQGDAVAAAALVAVPSARAFEVGKSPSVLAAAHRARPVLPAEESTIYAKGRQNGLPAAASAFVKRCRHHDGLVALEKAICFERIQPRVAGVGGIGDQ
jgi:hypothetical protein